MAFFTFKFKRSGTSGNSPTLADGEIAIQQADKRILTANATTVFDAFQNTVSSIAISNGTAIYFVGNSTTNAIVNSTSITFANSTVTFSLTKPTAAQVTAGNYFPGANGVWQQVTGGSGSPGGSNTNIQFDDSGSFAGSNSLTWNKTSNTLGLSGNLIANADYIWIGNSTVNSTYTASSLIFGNSTVNTSINTTSMAINGKPYGIVLLANGTVSAVTTLAINLASYGTGYRGYKVEYDNMILSGANNLLINLSSDGATYYASAQTLYSTVTTTPSVAASSSAAGLLGTTNLATTAWSLQLETFNPSNTTGNGHMINYNLTQSGSNCVSGIIRCSNASFTSLGGIKISTTSTPTFTGTYAIYGYI